MGRKIGVDFGTTNSIISFLPKGGEPQEYNNPCEGAQYTSSAICYKGTDTIIGQNAFIMSEDEEGDEVYRFFKMFLNDPDLKAWKGAKDPTKVAEDFLRELLISEENNCSFEQAKEKIDSIALTVPAFWDESENNLGLSNVKKVIEKLGFKKIRLLSEPQAAAAYYLWWHEQNRDRPFEGKLLVCDMGGGTFDVSLVQASSHEPSAYEIKVLFNTGDGRNGLGGAGVAFDSAICNRALEEITGEDISEAGKNGRILLRDFEKAKITQFTRRLSIIKSFEDKVFAGQSTQNMPPLFKVGYANNTLSIPITGELLQEVFKEEIRPDIEKVLNKLKNYLKKYGQDFDKIIIVGGFGRFVLVKQAIMDILGLSRDSTKLDDFGGASDGRYAIARGAALVAEGIVSVEERIKYDLGFIANLDKGGRSKSQKTFYLNPQRIRIRRK